MSRLAARQRRPGAILRGAKPTSVDDAHEQYAGEWVIMKVTAMDEQNLPSRGEIVAHSPSHAAI